MPEQLTAPESYLDPAGRRIGSVLDSKWTLDSLLGVGGMAAVYGATHRNGARAAIKLFPFSVTTSAEFAERILREGYLANKIGHPSVVRVLDDHLDREREYAYLVMELLEGETARQRVERTGPMSPLEAVKYMIDLVDCLAVAHARGVVHRDIKPENLFLTEEGKLKVLDFGVARALDGTSSSVTRTGAMLGTPAYMSPEQARGRPSEVSARSDLYSAGATLLFLVAGEFLHEGESAQEIMVRAAWTPAKKIRERNLGLPDVVTEIIDGACSFEQAERYQTAGEMRAALEAALAILSADPEAAEPVVRIPKRTVRGPISTAPLALSTPRSNPHGETLAEATPPPPEGATLTVATRRARRRAWWVIAATGSAILFAVVMLVSRLFTGKPKAAEHEGALSVHDAPKVAAPPVTAAPPPLPEPVEEAPVVTAPVPVPPTPGETEKSRTAAASHRTAHAAPAKPTGKTPAAEAPAQASGGTGIAKKPSLGRDIGY
jgi:serine/threonine protein kinase